MLSHIVQNELKETKYASFKMAAVKISFLIYGSWSLPTLLMSSIIWDFYLQLGAQMTS